MSTIVYGGLTRSVERDRQLAVQEGTAETPDQKLAKITQAVTALVPTEVLAIHAAVLAYATVIGDGGSTTVTKPDLLKWSLPFLAAVAIALYFIGHRGPLEPVDVGRALIPATAFVTWTLLMGTSAATPWIEDLDRGWLILFGGAAGAIVIALSLRLAPSSP